MQLPLTQIIDKFQLDEGKLVKFLMRVEEGYPNNPYHNRIHAADVLRSLHVLVVRGGLITQGYCDEIALMACYLSAVGACTLDSSSSSPCEPRDCFGCWSWFVGQIVSWSESVVVRRHHGLVRFACCSAHHVRSICLSGFNQSVSPVAICKRLYMNSHQECSSGIRSG